MQHPIHWLYQQFVGALPETSLRCYLCGAWSAEERYPVAKGIADTFNSHFLAKAPSSPWLCAACFWYFDGKTGHPDFRKMSLMVWETGWKQWQRADMKQDISDTVRHGTGEDVFLVCSLSKKKHILLQAPLNLQGTRLLAVQVEEQVAYLDQTTWQVMNHAFMRLLELGHNKGEILSGQLYGNTLRKHGQIKEALSHSQMLETYRNSAALELLSYSTIIEKEEGDATTNNARTGDGSYPSGGTPAESRLESDRQRVQEQVPHGHLDANREQRSCVRTDEQHAGEVSQHSLW